MKKGRWKVISDIRKCLKQLFKYLGTLYNKDIIIWC